jgi:hypothetical protein
MLSSEMALLADRNALDRERLLDIEFFIWESLKRLLVGEGSR